MSKARIAVLGEFIVADHAGKANFNISQRLQEQINSQLPPSNTAACMQNSPDCNDDKKRTSKVRSPIEFPCCGRGLKHLQATHGRGGRGLPSTPPQTPPDVTADNYYQVLDDPDGAEEIDTNPDPPSDDEPDLVLQQDPELPLNPPALRPTPRPMDSLPTPQSLPQMSVPSEQEQARATSPNTTTNPSTRDQHPKRSSSHNNTNSASAGQGARKIS